DVHPQRADRPAVLEPRGLGAVDLDELAEARPPGPWRLATPRAVGARHPKAGRCHPPAPRFDGEGEAVLLGEFLMREGRTEIAVPLAHEGQRVLASGRGQPVITGSATTAGRQRLGAVSLERSVQAPNLALAQPE